MINALKQLLSKEQLVAFDSLLEDEEISSDFTETLLIHEAEDFDQAIVAYEEIINNIYLSEADEELISVFKQLAENNTVLTEFVAGKDSEVKPNADEADSDEPEEAEVEATISLDEEPIDEQIEETDEGDTEPQQDENLDVDDEEDKTSSIEIISETEVNYRGYLSNVLGTIYMEPGNEEIQTIGELEGTEVKVLKEAETPIGIWLYVDVIGTSVKGWVEVSNVSVEEVLSNNQVKYRGYLVSAEQFIFSK